jgi:cyclohexyl-isocyanide hydratase
MNRRNFATGSIAGMLASMIATRASAQTQTAPNAQQPASMQHHEMDLYRHLWDGPQLTIAMLVYPGMFLQDLVGPLAMFEALMKRDIHLVWKDAGPLPVAANAPRPFIPVAATTSFAQCPKTLDVLFVPGGVPGTQQMMEDPEVLAFLRDRADNARFVTSVCTGSLILAAAGLLNGYKATSYWSVRDKLAAFGATPVDQRVVIDRNRITGGGVTAGLDFGLKVVSLLRSEIYAEAVQLYLEYNPQPPFHAGSPQTAPKEATAWMDTMYAGLRKQVDEIALRTHKKIQTE